MSDFEVFVYVCDKCDETLSMEIESEFAKIPFESSWVCKCGNFLRIKWDGKELTYPITERKVNESLLRMIDNDIRFWQRALILFIFLPPIIFLIWTILRMWKVFP